MFLRFLQRLQVLTIAQKLKNHKHAASQRPCVSHTIPWWLLSFFSACVAVRAPLDGLQRAGGWCILCCLCYFCADPSKDKFVTEPFCVWNKKSEKVKEHIIVHTIRVPCKSKACMLSTHTLVLLPMLMLVRLPNIKRNRAVKLNYVERRLSRLCAGTGNSHMRFYDVTYVNLDDPVKEVKSGGKRSHIME